MGRDGPTLYESLSYPREPLGGAMTVPGLDCEDLEREIRDLERDIAQLRQILNDEPDLSPGTVAHIHQQVFEKGRKLASVRSELENCRSEFTVVGVEATQGTQYFSINGQGSGRGADNAVPLAA